MTTTTIVTISIVIWAVLTIGFHAAAWLVDTADKIDRNKGE